MPETFDHVMIDIETMALHPHRSMILSIGMVEFDPAPIGKPTIGKTSLIVPDVIEQLMLKRWVTMPTQEFWADKKQLAAAEHWRKFSGVRDSAFYTIQQVRNFCLGKNQVWANGTQFDLSNLIGLAEDVGQTDDLWYYRAPRDMRTFIKTTPVVPGRLVEIGTAIDLGEYGIPHEPIYDCLVQIHQVWQHWQNGIEP